MIARRQPPGPNGPAATRRRAWLRPVVQFSIAGVIAVVLLIVGAGWLSKKAATDEAISDARRMTEILGRSVAQPELSEAMVDPGNPAQSAAIDRFDSIARHRLLVGDVLRVKIWNSEGIIVYSDDTSLIGQNFGLGDEERKVLEHGGTDAEVSDLSKAENIDERSFGRLLEVYSQIWTPKGQPLLFEAYYSYDVVSQRSSDIQASFRPITVAGLLIFTLLIVPLVWILARRLDRAAAERERLLTAAVEASAVERRRIARDLHDGVVQDLAGLSFAASAASRDLKDDPELAARMESLGVGVRSNLRALRSLLVEIYPPELRTEGLAAALDDLIAPAIAAGIDVDLNVEDTEGSDDDAIGLVWRTAQEVVRNAVRHGQPEHLRVAVAMTDASLILTVEDDGRGFDPSAAPRDGHLGLRALRDLIHEMGADFTLESTPGTGTKVRMEVAR
ncbi:MAG TPA: sensor histidine kinase [Nocardioidaceae bacterium]|nr:sensor histidine kinase [Nocardioidaceae bacterium]